MKKDRLQEILLKAIRCYEQDLQTFEHTEEEAHEILLEYFDMTEKEYKEITSK